MCAEQRETSKDILLSDLRRRERSRLITLQVLRHNSYLMSDNRVRLVAAGSEVASSQTDSASKEFHNHFTHFPCSFKKLIITKLQCHDCKTSDSRFVWVMMHL